MPLKDLSIFLKLFTAFLLLTLLTIALTYAMELLSISSALPEILTEIRSEHASKFLCAAYNREKGWDLIEEDSSLMESLEDSFSEETSSLRYVLRDSGGRTVYNSFSRITIRGETPLMEGKTVALKLSDSTETIGTLTVYISRDFVEQETLKYIASMTQQRFFEGIVIILISSIIALTLSRKISYPIKSLTSAAEKISHRESSELLPVNTTDELGQMSRAFNRMIVSLENQKELRKNLVRNISHDICTPLNNIRLEARGIRDGLISGKNAAEHIMEEVDKLNNLIDDLEWLSRTDSGEFKLNIKECSLVDVAKKEVERWQLQAEIKGISLSMLPCEEDFPAIKADPLRLSRALGNIIDNCIKFTSAGGTVSVEVTREKEFLILSVCDTGPGIEERHLPYIFERFYRAEKDSSRGGRGLGLSIAKQIVELHDGVLHAESEPSEGARFYFTFTL